MAEERMLTVEEVSSLLHVTPKTVRRWIHLGKIKAKRIGRPWHIPASAVEEALQKGIKKEGTQE